MLPMLTASTSADACPLLLALPALLWLLQLLQLKAKHSQLHAAGAKYLHNWMMGSTSGSRSHGIG